MLSGLDVVRPAVLLLLLVWPCASWAESPRLIGTFVENERKEVAVGGVYVVGLMRGSVLGSGSPRGMHVWIPDNPFDLLCVQVRSIDGRYEGTARFDIAQTEGGAYPLEFQTSKAELVASYGPGELVLDGRVGNDCDKPEDLVHVVMGWSESSSPEHLLFFVNTDGHEAFVQLPLKADGAQVRSVPCRAVPSGRPLRVFSAYCVVERPTLVDFSESWLELRRFGEVVAWEKLAVAQAPGP
jgi:hypothetical protein